MTDRLPVHALDPAGATDGQVPTYHAATGVAWTDGPVGGVQSVVAGTGVTVDDTDPAHPIVSATGGGGGSSTGTYRGDWTSGETLLATYDFAAQAVNDPPPAPFTYANGSGWVKVVNYVAFTTPIPSPPAHMMELRDNGAKLTLPVGTSHPTANKVRFWLGNNSDGGASAYVNGVQQGTELTGLGAGWEQRTVTVAPATDTVEWRHRRTNVAGSVAGYVARIEVLASSTASSYAVNDVVRYGSALWACLVANTAQTPGAGSDWQKIADITDPEVVRDTMASALVAGTNVTITPDDAANTITISAAGGGAGGGGWTQHINAPGTSLTGWTAGGGTGTWAVNANGFSCTGNSGTQPSRLRYNTLFPTPIVVADAEFRFLSGSSDARAGFSIGHDGTSGGGIFVRLHADASGNGNSVDIEVDTTAGRFTKALAWGSVNTWHRLRTITAGGVATVWVDDTLVGSAGNNVQNSANASYFSVTAGGASVEVRNIKGWYPKLPWE